MATEEFCCHFLAQAGIIRNILTVSCSDLSIQVDERLVLYFWRRQDPAHRAGFLVQQHRGLAGMGKDARGRIIRVHGA